MRYAGDAFNIPLGPQSSSGSSVLVDYFPELKQIGASSSQEEEPDGARGYGSTKSVAPFTGFKTLESPGEKNPAPEFFGFKTFEF